MKVTDKDYYLNEKLVTNLDFCLKRQKKSWDNVLLIDGDERIGKSTVSWAIAYYLAYKEGIKFTHEHVFFDPEDMITYARNHKRKVLVWDEAALGALSSEWFSKTQRKLIKMLMMFGKYNNFYIFIVPSYFELKKYIAVRRSIGLLHCYTPDNITRGHFTFYNKKKKKNLYLNDALRKFENYGKDYSFHGMYTNTDSIIDITAYDKKKDEALSHFDEGNEAGDKYKDELAALKYKISLLPLQQRRLADCLGVSDRTLRNWKKQGAESGAP